MGEYVIRNNTTPDLGLHQAWEARTDFNNELYELNKRKALQAGDIAHTIANGAEAALDQFVYAALGAHPDWKAVYDRIAKVNEKIQLGLPLAIFNNGDLRYFGYPKKYGNTLYKKSAFTQSMEDSASRNARFNYSGSSDENAYYSSLSLPMRTLYDLEPSATRFKIEKQEDTALEPVFIGYTSTRFTTPHAEVNHTFHLTTLDAPQEGTLVVASDWCEIITAVGQNPSLTNIQRLKFIMRHDEDDQGRYAD